MAILLQHTDLVHTRNDLTNLQKLHYLQSSLKDEALAVIKNPPITNEKYTTALELLKKRFDKKYILAFYNADCILNINSTKRESMNTLSKFINEISYVNSLNQCKFLLTHMNLLLCNF